MESTGWRQGSRRGSSQHKEHSLKRLSHPPLSFPVSITAYVGGFTFRSPIPTSNPLLLFYIVVILHFLFGYVPTRHFFLMLNLLLVLCDSCSALSFLLPSVEGWRRGHEERLGISSRAVVTNPEGFRVNLDQMMTTLI